jgi:hypothetical protein
MVRTLHGFASNAGRVLGFDIPASLDERSNVAELPGFLILQGGKK